MNKLWPLSVLTLLAACSPLKPEPVYINVKPQLAPLSAEILQAMQPDSTDLLKRAAAWYGNSGKLLDSVTGN